MSERSNRQSGIASTAFILALVLILIVGFAIFKLVQSQSKDKQTVSTSTSETAQLKASDAKEAADLIAYLHQEANKKYSGSSEKVVVEDISDGSVAFKAGSKDFYTSINQENSGFNLSISDTTTDEEGHYVKAVETSKYLVEVAKKDLGLKTVDLQLPELLGFFAYNYLENDSAICAFGDGTAMPVTASCVNKSEFEQAGVDQEPFAQAFKAVHPSDVNFVAGVRPKQGANGYIVAEGSAQNAHGYFYQKKDGVWVFLFGTQQAPGCDSFENNPEAAKAFEGTPCFDYAIGDDQPRTVKRQ